MNKKYKHKPTGKIYVPHNNNRNLYKHYCQNDQTAYTVHKSIVEIGNDWEEWKEPTYEILSLKHVNTIYYSTLNRHTDGSVVFQASPIEMMSPFWRINESVFIHSIKRLSDGEIFTVGDKCIKTGFSNITFDFKIDTIHLGKSSIGESVILQQKLGCIYCSLEEANKCKRIPFAKTIDGVDIYEGDTYYKVLKNNNYQLVRLKDQYHVWKDVTLFHSKDKAEEYVIMNKPCLSLTDVFIHTSLYKSTKDKLKEFVKSKLNFK